MQGRAFLAAVLVGLYVPGAGAAQQVDWQVAGVDGVLRDNVLALTATTRSAPVDDDDDVTALANRAARQARTALEPFGYYEATSRASVTRDGSGWAVVVNVTPGPPVRVAAAAVRVLGEGSEDPELGAAVAAFPIEVGSVLSHPTYDLLKARLASVAADRGYLDAAFDSAVIAVDRERREARIALQLATGPRYALGEVRFLQDALDPSVLQSMVPWAAGDPYSADRLLALQNELSLGPYFATVEVAPRRDRAVDRVVPIDVRLTPAPAQRYAAGGGYGSDTGPRGTLSAEFRRLNRAGHRGEFDIRVAQVEIRTSARYLIPLRGRRGAVLTLSGGYVDLHPSTSDTETWLAGTNVAGLIGGWRTEVGVTLQRASYDVADQSGITRLLLGGVGVSRVRADDRLAPARGSLIRLRGRAGIEGALSDVSLREVAVETRIIRSPWGPIRLRGRAEAALLSTSAFDRLPGSIRYFAGGDRSVRGFGYQELGPTNARDQVVGGSRLLVLSGEAEWRFHPDFGVAAFYDMGNALTSFDDALERGTGAGLRWLSPVGMVRLDGAWAVSRPGAPFKVHLSLGPEL